MAKSVFDAPQFKTEEGAFAYVESRLWPNGPVCPHCGNCDGSRIRKMTGKTTRLGLHKCNECRKPFTVRMGTIFESSHLGLHLWLQVIHLMCASKKGISTNQIQRMLQCSMKTAWFLSHRIREAMASGTLPPLGGEGKTVEIDETFYGTRYQKPEGARGYAHKNAVLTLVERGGNARSFHVDGIKAADLLPIIKANVDPKSRVMTDEAGQYASLGKHFTEHDFVRHSIGEYGRGDASTNAVEGFYSVFKRGMVGVYQHCSSAHLHRYASEFDFRFNHRIKLGVDDVQRADAALAGVVGKRLTYRTIGNSPSGD